MAGIAEASSPAAGQPVAVVDIGSNTIRLVVYSGLDRAAVRIFNERVFCALGRDLSATGRLNPDGVELAQQNLVRFTRLARAMGIRRIDFLATAAVREAKDGAEFAVEVERLCGQPVQVLSSREEARLSALGVIAGFPRVTGLMGDMGGGSLELVELSEGRIGRSITLPLGPFRLMELYGEDRKAMTREIEKRLEATPWFGVPVDANGGRSFYAVGGAWRNLARIHLEQSRYPLHVTRGYAMTFDQVRDIERAVRGAPRWPLAQVAGVSKPRAEVLPAAALVLRRTMRMLACPDVTFSAFGLRDGHIFDLMTPEEQAKDPLLAMCEDIARRETRFDRMGAQLTAWTDPLFPNQSPAARRLREASCLMSDIAWREDSDHRDWQALDGILYYPFAGVTHPERIFLGMTGYIRQGGDVGSDELAPFRRLLSPEVARDARILGLAQRLAYRVSGATAAILQSCRLSYDGSVLSLELPKEGSAPGGDAVERRLKALAQALDAKSWTIKD